MITSLKAALTHPTHICNGWIVDIDIREFRYHKLTLQSQKERAEIREYRE